MLNLLLKLKERKEYEAQLIEYSKPFKFMSTESRESYFKRLDEAAKDFNEPIYQYFYWYKYWESMFLDVIIPLVRVCNLILRKRLCPILLESESIEDFLPCTYPEAFIFFQKLDVSDRKTILQKWTDSYQYVDIMDCIERGDDVKFAIVFGKVENAVKKLSSIKFAKKYFPNLP